MQSKATLAQVERLAAQLPLAERLKLVARICEELSDTQQTERVRHGRSAKQVEAWLAECDAVAEGVEGKFDAAEDLRQVREERANRL